MHKSRNLQPKGSFFVVLVGFPIAKLLTVFQSKSEVKRWNWVNFSHFETLNSTSRRLCVTISSVTTSDITSKVRLKRRCRQNDSHGITVVTQRNYWKSNIFGADSILKKKTIKRASNLVLTFYRKNKDFNNGNSLSMTEQEDISSCYFTIEETSRVKNSPWNSMED